jgi:stage II sporulation protein R
MINEVCNMKTVNIKWVYKILTGITLLFGLLLYVSLPAAVPETSVSSDGLIRLHVLANSDSEADQELKRKVRDEIIRVMASEFLASANIDSARQTARANLNRIEVIASSVIQAEGKDYPVTAELDTFPFPTKHYGAFILPAGDYEAVRVVIGNGGGTNWWCVLFPPLCFVDMTRNLAMDTAAINFPANSLTPDAAAVKKPKQTLDTKTDSNIDSKNEVCLPNEPKVENFNPQKVEDANSKVFGEESDGKVVFSFRLVEWFKRL